MARNRNRQSDSLGSVLGLAITAYTVLFMGYLCSLILYRGDTFMFLKHGVFVCVHLYIIGVKRHSLKNFDGFDFLFGIFYLYFWFEEPLGFMLSYVYWALAVAWVLKKVPLWDEA